MADEFVRRGEMDLALSKHGEKFISRAFAKWALGAIGGAIVFVSPVIANYFSKDVGAVEAKANKNSEQIATLTKEASELAAHMKVFIAQSTDQRDQAARVSRDVASLTNQVAAFVGESNQRFRYLEKQMDSLNDAQRGLAAFITKQAKE